MQNTQMMERGVSRTREGDAKSAKPSAEEESYGHKLLELAEGEAAGLQGGMRAYANLRLARGYQRTDKKKAISYLENAFAATQEIDDDKAPLFTRSKLQVDILKALAQLDAKRAEELLVQVDASRRAEVLQSLLSYYTENKKIDRAVDVLYRISAESEFPYDSAVSVMAALPPEKSADLAQIFSTALTSYRQHAGRKEARYSFASQDLTVLVKRFSKQLPSELVKEAILEILKQADPAEKPAENKDQQPMMTIASREGAAAFSNNYQYKLFELVPVLREVDKDEADRLLKKNQEAAELLQKFPNGMEPDGQQNGAKRDGDGGPRESGAMMMVGAGPGGPGGNDSGEMAAEMREFSKMEKILDDAEAHPEQALASIATLQSKNLRGSALLDIAQATWKKNASVAKSALKQFMELAPEMRAGDESRLLSRAASLYMKMGAEEDAKRVVDKELDAAAAMLKQDTNSDDPNKALKAYWPSTNAYGSALQTAGQISPAWALTILKDMPDAEIRFCSEMALAAKWLRLPVGMTQTISATKKGVRMMMEDVR
jgi:hypothetical protein